jgi:aspartokinase
MPDSLVAIPRERRAEFTVESVKDLAILVVVDPRQHHKGALAAAVLHVADQERVSVVDVMQSSSRAAIAVVVRRHQSGRLSRGLSRARPDGTGSAPRIDTVEAVSSLSLRGDIMAGRPGYAGRFFTALGRANVPILAAVQGSAETTISCYVRSTHRRRGERALREAFPHDVAVHECDEP